jgi:hypothetical protein
MAAKSQLRVLTSGALHKGLLTMAGMLLALQAQPAELEVLSTQTPWGVWMVMGGAVSRDKNGQPVVRLQKGEVPLSAENAKLSDLPPAGWQGKDFDDSVWGRYGDELAEWAGLWGRDFRGNAQPTLLCLRMRFGVSDPARATDVKLTLEYIGGFVACVNAVEVGRGHLPPGKIEPYTPAADYPVEAYTAEDGLTPLPRINMGGQPDDRLLSRYQARVRKATLAVPTAVLVKGSNVLTLELHRSPVSGPTGFKDMMWWHLGIGAVKLTVSSGAGVIPYGEAAKGPRVWNAQTTEQIADTLQARALLDRGAESISLRGAMQRGLALGNPFDPVVPLRILVPRNGTGNGQTVLSDPEGLRTVRASLGEFRNLGGAVLPAKAVRIWFAAQGNLHWCDELSEQPPQGAKTLPVWLEVSAPKDQPPGWYVSCLSLEANGKKFQVPVQLLVTGFTVPDPRDFRSVVVAMHSPEATAKAYSVKPYSDEHFRVMEKSVALMGQLGNDVMLVPVIIGTHMHHETGLIRWVKTAGGLKPDYTLFEKYLDLYLKHIGPPKAISLYVWSQDTGKEVANAYENRQIPSREFTPSRPLQVTVWNPRTGASESVTAPTFLDQGAEAFWKPMLDGVRDLVKKRGWPERVILMGIGSDTRPSQRTGALLRQWAPSARWDIYSHFSGDPGAFYKGPPLPGSAPGKFIAIGDLEVGLKEVYGYYMLTSAQLENYLHEKNEYLTATIQRCGPGTKSAPLAYRTQPMHDGRWTRLGVDFWPKVSRYHGLIWGATPVWLSAPGPKGPLPTVRLQMIREGLQDFEARMAILDASAKLPAEQQKPYRDLLDDLLRRVKAGGGFLFGAECLPLTELSYDWPAYVARLHAAAAELSGVKTEARWEQPPQP